MHALNVAAALRLSHTGYNLRVSRFGNTYGETVQPPHSAMRSLARLGIPAGHIAPGSHPIQ